SVTDTGNGIPKEKRSQLFQPFERLGAEGSQIEGTGIGLTITKSLIEMMHGNIGFDSEVGVGTVFWIELPEAVNGVSQPNLP
ncbi:MAG: ATP-binding protein, partial [Nitrosomonas sp.]|nr:ATP-binding protein [Nitrosomonas sp.]